MEGRATKHVSEDPHHRPSTRAWTPGPEPGIVSDVGPFPVAPTPGATVAVLGYPPPRVVTCLGLGPLGTPNQPVIGTHHWRERHGRAGSGERELPRACLASLEEGTGGSRQRGCSERLREREGLSGQPSGLQPSNWARRDQG